MPFLNITLCLETSLITYITLTFPQSTNIHVGTLIVSLFHLFQSLSLSFSLLKFRCMILSWTNAFTVMT